MARTTAVDRLREPVITGPTGSRIQVPHNFSMRSYQMKAAAAMDARIGGDQMKRAYSRAMTVWHRRAGKDAFWLNQMIKEMVRATYCGTYLYIFPVLTQGRRDLWDAKTSPDTGGRPFRSFFPPELVMESSETEMQITLHPLAHQNPTPMSNGKGGVKKVGSVFQIMGTDKKSIENIRGINTVGVVFSEYSDQNPDAWATIVEPILLETKGWAGFNLTPKGKNHAWDLWRFAQTSPAWYTHLMTVDESRRDAVGEDGSAIMTPEQIQELRDQGRAEEIIQQEYYCSFDGYLQGTIYGDLFKRAQADGRVTRVPYLVGLPVGTMWDIGRTDATAIWFYQVVGQEIRFIDYYSNIRQGADHYAQVCNRKGYIYSKMILPHDARVKGYTSNESTEEFLARTVCRNVVVVPQSKVQQGIDTTRRMFSRFVFDEHNCDTAPAPGVPSGIDCMKSYRREWDEEKKEYKAEPVHDQYSHGADALRTGCMGWEEGLNFLVGAPPKEVKVESYFDLQQMSPVLGHRRSSDGIVVQLS